MFVLKRAVLLTLIILVFSVFTFAQTQTCTNCGVGETNPAAKLEVKGCGNTDATNTLQTTNSDGTKSLTVTDAQTVNLHNSQLVFANGLATNLVSQYLILSGNYDGANKYVTIKTNIPFQKNAMMGSVKIKYWSYGRNFEMNVGWYTYPINSVLSFYQPTATAFGFLGGAMTFKDIILSVDDGKVNISIPHSYFQGFGTINAETNSGAIYLTDDWHKGWAIEKDMPSTGVSEAIVDINMIEGVQNLGTKDIKFKANRTHDLDGHSLRFNNGSVGIGTISNAYRFSVSAQTSNSWAGWFRGSPNNHGLLVDVQSSSSGVYPLWVRTDGGTKTALAVKANNRVGVGTPAPNFGIQVGDGATSNGDIGLRGHNGADPAYKFINSQGGLIGAIGFDHSESTKKMHFAPVAVTSDQLMTLDFNSDRVGIGTTAPQEKLDVVGNLILQSANQGWYTTLKFDLSSDGNGVSLEAMRTDDHNNKGRYIALNPEGGNVGIGTSSPQSILEVKANDPWLKIEDKNSNSYATTNAGIQFNNGYATVGQIYQEGEHLNIESRGGNSKMSFSTNNQERVSIDNKGKVQISEALILTPQTGVATGAKLGEMMMYDDGNGNYTLKIWMNPTGVGNSSDLAQWETIEFK